jgi:hypothetical protein
MPAKKPHGKQRGTVTRTTYHDWEAEVQHYNKFLL